MSIPEPDIEIKKELAIQLIHDQFPEFSKLKISFLSNGYDNANFQLGDSHLIRLPRRSVGAELIVNEIEWLPKLQYQLPIKVPVPVKIGSRTNNYPWSWTIVPFFRGKSVLGDSLNEKEINRLVRFLKKLHQIDADHAPENPFRSVPLSKRALDVDKRIKKLENGGFKIPDQIKQLWESAINEPMDLKHCLIHGDLHPDNIIVKNKKIEAIIDWGDITKGDPAADLASFWMLIENPDLRTNAFAEYGASKATVNRSKGWAVFFAVIFLLSKKEYQNLGLEIFKALL